MLIIYIYKVNFALIKINNILLVDSVQEKENLKQVEINENKIDD